MQKHPVDNDVVPSPNKPVDEELHFENIENKWNSSIHHQKSTM
jgi:hypothetical protein